MTRPQHVERILRHVLAARRSSSTPPVFRSYYPTTTSLRGQDVLAKYRRPAVPPVVLPSVSAQLDSIAADKKGDAFGTTATVPAGTSFQEVPLASAASKVHVETPIPAMIPTDEGLVGAGGKLDTAQTRKEMTVQGVVIPPKPIPPGEEECCMSGCVHCIYTIYSEDLEFYTEAIDSAREALRAASIPEKDWPDELQMQDGGEVKEAEERKVEQSMDPSMAAFLALENKLKKQQAPNSSAAT